jgi:hypothetical protein
MELSASFYKENKKDIDDEPFHEFSYSNIFDMSNIQPGEIEIEDEIRLSKLWFRYGRE